jgi:FHS family L-fucose permease-like MFS transporter
MKNIEASIKQFSSIKLPVILITSLFFLWGFSYGLLDVLNKHFQEVLHIGKRESSLLQAAYFGAYFMMALPAGKLMQRFGYKTGILSGLIIFSCGAFLFYPAALFFNFSAFLFALFVLATGLTFLETAANPLMTVIGKPERAAFRLNLAQSFNGVGSIAGPLLGGYFFFGLSNATENFNQVQFMYLGIGLAVLILALVIFKTQMPEPDKLVKASGPSKISDLFRDKRFMAAVIAQFFYVAAQVGVAAFFINYCTEQGGSGNKTASYFLSIAMVLFTLGRFTGTALLRIIAPSKLLTGYAFINVVLCLVVVFAIKPFNIIALIVIFFYESVMFPTIFTMGLRNMNDRTQIASSVLVMSIVGGAIVPYFMGMIADRFSTATAYLIPMFCFMIVAWFGWISSKENAV